MEKSSGIKKGKSMSKEKEEIQYVGIEQVIPYENNPRDNDRSVDKVAASIAAFGFKQPIVVDRDMIVVVGHTRLKAAQKLGKKVVPVIIADDLTEEQARAYRLADNKAGEDSVWDFGKLDIELEQITNIDMSDFGFGPVEFPELDQGNEGAKEYDTEEFSDEQFQCECPKCGFKFNP